MTKTTRPAALTNRPTLRYCSWHQALSRTARLVQITADQGSGTSTPDLYACAPCRSAYDLTVIPEQPLTDALSASTWHVAGCPACSRSRALISPAATCPVGTRLIEECVAAASPSSNAPTAPRPSIETGAAK